MSFRETVQGIDQINDCPQAGLQALGSNSKAVVPANARQCQGSVDLDGCLQTQYPNAPRWDYLIGYAGRAYFVEVHPATTRNVDEVINKLRWLKNWLETTGAALKPIRGEQPYRWVASGKVAILAGSPQARRLAEAGLSLPKRQVHLP